MKGEKQMYNSSQANGKINQFTVRARITAHHRGLKRCYYLIKIPFEFSFFLFVLDFY